MMGGARITFRGLAIDCGRAGRPAHQLEPLHQGGGQGDHAADRRRLRRLHVRRLGGAHGERPELRALGRDRLVALLRALPAAHALDRPGRGRPGRRGQHPAPVRARPPDPRHQHAHRHVRGAGALERPLPGAGARLAGHPREPDLRRYEMEAARDRAHRQDEQVEGARPPGRADDVPRAARRGGQPVRGDPGAAAGRAHARERPLPRPCLRAAILPRPQRHAPAADERQVGQCRADRARPEFHEGLLVSLQRPRVQPAAQPRRPRRATCRP